MVDPSIIVSAISGLTALGLGALAHSGVVKKLEATKVASDVEKDWPVVKSVVAKDLPALKGAAAKHENDIAGLKTVVDTVSGAAKNVEARVTALESKAPAPVADVAKQVEVEVAKQFRTLFPQLVTPPPAAPSA